MSGLFEPSQVAKREDLLDVLTRVDSRNTPFLSMARRGPTPHNTLLEWPVDDYADPDTVGVVDGTDVSSYENHAENRAILRTYLQTFRRTAKVSRLAQEVSDVAGVNDEIAEAISKKTIELGRDIESTLLGDQEHQVDDGTNPYLTRGMGLWLLDTANIASQTTFQVPVDFRPANGAVINTAAASLTETNVQDLLKAIYDEVGMPQGSYCMFCGSTLRRAITDFTRTVSSGSTNTQVGTRNFNFDGNSTSIVDTTTMFEGDYGVIEIKNSSWLGWNNTTKVPDLDRGYLIDMDMVDTRWHKQPTVERFEDQGGGERFMVEARVACQVRNPKGQGQIQPGLS